MTAGMMSARTRLLVLGDVAALVVFALIGRRSHEEPASLASLVETAAPFVVAWLSVMAVAALTARAGVAPPGSGPRDLVRSALRTWLVAFPVAVLLRAAVLGRFSPWTFYVVAFIAAFALIAGWRVAFALAERRFHRSAA